MVASLGATLQMIRRVTRRMWIATIGAALLPANPHAPRAAPLTIGVLDSSAAIAAKLTAFYEGLRTEGFVRNQNLTVQYHSAQGDYARLPGLTADLLGRQVSLISALGAPAALAAKRATTTIPIVVAVSPDPVSLGLVASLNHPGANLTGVTSVAAGREQKRLELLHEAIPTATEFGVLVNPRNSNADTQIHEALTAAQVVGTQIKLIRASSSPELESAFAELPPAQARGLVIADDDFFLGASGPLAVLAARYRIPAIFEGTVFTAAGGFMSYGSRMTELYHQAGVWSGLVLNGAAPGELSMYQSRDIDMVVNLRSANSLGINLPQNLIDQANTLIK